MKNALVKKLISKLSWDSTSFPDKLNLFWVSNIREHFKIYSGFKFHQSAGLLALASTYHSIAGSAVSQINRRRREFLLSIVLCTVAFWLGQYRIFGISTLFTLRWFILGGWCWIFSLLHAKKAIELRGDEATAEELEIFSCILIGHLKYSEALDMVWKALERNPKPHTEGLLYTNLAKIQFRKGNVIWCCATIHKAMIAAIQVHESEPDQAYRIYRKVSAIYPKIKTNPLSAGVLRLLNEFDKLPKSKIPKDQVLKSF